MSYHKLESGCTIEVFRVDGPCDFQHEDGKFAAPGWYYWYCMPGYMPDSDAFGPFKHPDEAVKDAQDAEEYLLC